MNCHIQIKPNSPLLKLLKDTWDPNHPESGNPIPWKRIHRLPDYVYFNHAIHVNRGVGCVTCHGRVDEKEVMDHFAPLSMSWCLDCHRHPEGAVRPLEEVMNMTWTPPAGKTQEEIGRELVAKMKIKPRDTCQECHR